MGLMSISLTNNYVREKKFQQHLAEYFHFSLSISSLFKRSMHVQKSAGRPIYISEAESSHTPFSSYSAELSKVYICEKVSQSLNHIRQSQELHMQVSSVVKIKIDYFCDRAGFCSPALKISAGWALTTNLRPFIL